MLRKLLLGLVFVSVTGCSYPPLAYEENKPQLEDAVITRDLVVFGESRVVYYTDDGDYICSIVSDIEGWAEEEVDPADVGCVGCTENFTLAFFSNDETSCSHSIPGAATIAITPLNFFPLDAQPEWQWEILTETEDLPEDAGGPALAYLSTNWSPTGPSDWGPRAALYPAGEETGLDSYSREYYARGFYVWISSEGRAYWDMNLWLLE